jgi:hypothetical protein
MGIGMSKRYSIDDGAEWFAIQPDVAELLLEMGYEPDWMAIWGFSQDGYQKFVDDGNGGRVIENDELKTEPQPWSSDEDWIRLRFALAGVLSAVADEGE